MLNKNIKYYIYNYYITSVWIVIVLTSVKKCLRFLQSVQVPKNSPIANDWWHFERLNLVVHECTPNKTQFKLSTDTTHKYVFRDQRVSTNDHRSKIKILLKSFWNPARVRNGLSINDQKSIRCNNTIMSFLFYVRAVGGGIKKIWISHRDWLVLIKVLSRVWACPRASRGTIVVSRVRITQLRTAVFSMPWESSRYYVPREFKAWICI